MNLESMVVPNQWVLDDALSLIRALQPQIRKYGYHLCLGGGVLNKGRSEKDLDLYFLPMGQQRNPLEPIKLLEWLEGMWGMYEQIGGGGYPEEIPYMHRVTFKYGEQRIDVFVLGSGDELKKEIAEDEGMEPRDEPNPPIPYPLGGVHENRDRWRAVIEDARQARANQLNPYRAAVQDLNPYRFIETPVTTVTTTDTNGQANDGWVVIDNTAYPNNRRR